MRILFLIILLNILANNLLGQSISRPNPYALGVGAKYQVSDSGIVIGTFNGKPPTPSAAIRKEKKAIQVYDSANHVSWIWAPELNDWVVSGTGGSGSTITPITKDTAVTFTGANASVVIPTGISFTPINITISITNANSTAGDTGQGFSSEYDDSTQSIIISYPVAPIGTFTYHIVLTQSTVSQGI